MNDDDCDVAKQSTYLLMTSLNVTELSNKKSCLRNENFYCKRDVGGCRHDVEHITNTKRVDHRSFLIKLSVASAAELS